MMIKHIWNRFVGTDNAGEYQKAIKCGMEIGRRQAVRSLVKKRVVVFSDQSGYGSCIKVPVSEFATESELDEIINEFLMDEGS